MKRFATIALGGLLLAFVIGWVCLVMSYGVDEPSEQQKQWVREGAGRVK